VFIGGRSVASGDKKIGIGGNRRKMKKQNGKKMIGRKMKKGTGNRERQTS
jgi:hypothetical protein